MGWNGAANSVLAAPVDEATPLAPSSGSIPNSNGGRPLLAASRRCTASPIPREPVSGGPSSVAVLPFFNVCLLSVIVASASTERLPNSLPCDVFCLNSSSEQLDKCQPLGDV
jgi:hypothetical protein